MQISVLMSVYYNEKPEYLKEALESIINQTFKPSQIVIIKDGKLTSELDETLKTYKNKYENLIDIYSLEENQGLGTALKIGLEKCKFDYIARQDSDDISVLNRFEKQKNAFEKNEKLDIVGGFVDEYDEKMETILSQRKVPLKFEDIRKQIKKQNPYNHGTVIMKKDAILKAGNYNSVQFEDYDLWARMLISGCYMENISEVLCKNRTGNSMYKRRSGLKQIKKVIEIEKNLLNYKIINKVEFIINVLIRSVVALFPIRLKGFVYTKIIRKIK